MLERIIVNEAKTTAILVFTDRPSKIVACDKGQVLDLIIHLLEPSLNKEVTFNQCISSLNDTAIIKIA